MILKSINLENIRSYTNQKIEFSEGSTLLSGDIGSGKSSILLALEFALFGISKGTISGNSLLRNGKKEGSVELAFNLDEKEIKIKRTLKRQNNTVQQSTGFIEINGQKKDATPIELKSAILNLLGYPKEAITKKSYIYRYTVYCPQEEMKQILFDEPEHRINTLRKVFGIDKYKKIIANSMIFVSKLKEQKRELKGKIFDLEQKQTAKNENEEVIERLKIELEYLSPIIEDARKALEEKKKEIQKIENQLKEYTELKKTVALQENNFVNKSSLIKTQTTELNSLEPQINLLSQRIEKIIIDDADEVQKNEDIEDKIRIKEEELQTKSRSRLEANEKLENLTQRFEELTKEIQKKSEFTTNLSVKKSELADIIKDLKNAESFKETITKAENELMEIKNKVNEIEFNKNNSKKIKESIKSINQCPTCLQQIGAIYKIKVIEREKNIQAKADLLIKEIIAKSNEKSKAIAELKAKQDELLTKQSGFGKLEAEIASLEQINEELKEKKELIVGVEEQKKKNQEIVNMIKEEYIEELKREIIELKELNKKIMIVKTKLVEKNELENSLREKQNKKQELTKSIETLTSEIQTIKQSLESSKEKSKDYTGMDRIYEVVRKDVDKLIQLDKENGIKIASIKKEIEGYEKTSAILQKEIENKLESKIKIDKLSQYQDWIENYFINLMTTIEKNVFSKAYQSFNSLFREWFNLLIDDEILNVRLDPVFTPLIEQNGYNVDIEQLSGGEKTALALAYRLALNKVINSIMAGIKTKDLIILDEPTDGFSSEQLDRIRNVLEELNTNQTILVSHESKIESFVENVLRIEKHEHVSIVE